VLWQPQRQRGGTGGEVDFCGNTEQEDREGQEHDEGRTDGSKLKPNLTGAGEQEVG